MFNLYEILRNAQGGQALDNLAAQFNITTEQADEAVKALVPELSEGLLKQASEPVGFGSFLSVLGEGQYLAAYTDPAAAQESAQKGADYLSQILGSSSAREEIVLRASSAAGISQDTLAKMLPIIVSMIFGGLMKSMENQGFGGILGQLANAAGQGGLGPILGQILGGGSAATNPHQQPGPGPGPAARQGGLGSILEQILGGARSKVDSTQPPPSGPGQAGGLGGILGSILGRFSPRSGTGTGQGPAASTGVPQMPGFDTASIQAGLEALTKMLRPGTPPAANPQPQAPPPLGQQTDISAELDRIIGSKRDSMP
jgi:hypothetical protein